MKYPACFCSISNHIQLCVIAKENPDWTQAPELNNNASIAQIAFKKKLNCMKRLQIIDNSFDSLIWSCLIKLQNQKPANQSYRFSYNFTRVFFFFLTQFSSSSFLLLGHTSSLMEELSSCSRSTATGFQPPLEKPVVCRCYIWDKLCQETLDLPTWYSAILTRIAWIILQLTGPRVRSRLPLSCSNLASSTIIAAVISPGKYPSHTQG